MHTETHPLLTMALIIGMGASLQVQAVKARPAVKIRAADDKAQQDRTGDPKSSRPGTEVATLEIRVSLRSGKPEELEPAYRFLWKHWTARQAARVTVTFYGIDAGVRHIVTIRRGGRGIWQIDEHRRYYAARQRAEQAAALVQTARKVRTVESANTGFSLELIGPSGGTGRLFMVENWPKQ